MCKPPPLEAAATSGSGDIDVSSWRQAASSTAGAFEQDLLGVMLAEQEKIIQECGLRLREHKETAESLSSNKFAPRASTDGTPTHEQPVDRRNKGEGKLSQGLPAGLLDREIELELNLMDENAARTRPRWAEEGVEPMRRTRVQPMERSFDLTLTLAGDFVEELARGYSQPWFQELVHHCAQECCFNRNAFLMRLQDIAFEVQKLILENWGFEGDEQGVFDMTSILRGHMQGSAPPWLRERIDRCLTLLYGGAAGGMLGEQA